LLIILCCFGFVCDWLFIAVLVDYFGKDDTTNAMTGVVTINFKKMSEDKVHEIRDHVNISFDLNTSTVADVKRSFMQTVGVHGNAKLELICNGKKTDGFQRMTVYAWRDGIWTMIQGKSLSGGGLVGAKKDVKQNKSYAKLKGMTEQLHEKAKCVSEQSRINSTIKNLEPIFRDFNVNLNSNAKDAMSAQLHKLSIAEIEVLSEAFSNAGAGTAEGKFKVNGHLLFGQNIMVAKDLYNSLGAMIESATMLSTMAYTKAVTEDASFTLRSFNNMIVAVLNYKRGQAAASSSDGMQDIIQGMGQLGS
jgi:hypothetical protein